MLHNTELWSDIRRRLRVRIIQTQRSIYITQNFVWNSQPCQSILVSYLRNVLLRASIRMYVGRGGALVESVTFDQRVVSLNPALAITWGPWASPSLTVACVHCCGREHFWKARAVRSAIEMDKYNTIHGLRRQFTADIISNGWSPILFLCNDVPALFCLEVTHLLTYIQKLIWR